MRHARLAVVVCMLVGLFGTGTAAAELRDGPVPAARTAPGALHAGAARAVFGRRWASLRGPATRRLAERTFPSLVGGTTGSPELSNGLSIERLLGPTAAKVETATGRPAGVAVFGQPIATSVDDELKTVDLDLVARGSHLRSRRPAVDVRYPRQADGDVELPTSGVAFSPVGARSATTVPDANELFFPDALAGDVDYALVPQADGVEALWQLRTAASPETLRLRFDLPAGTRLRLVAGAPGAAEVIGVRGKALAAVKAPSAVDADGTFVDVTTRLEGDDLVYRVAHRDRGLSYPILVDPQVSEYWWESAAGQTGGGFVDCGGPAGNNSGAGAWSYAQILVPNTSAFLPACDMRVYGWGYGLYVQQYANRAYGNLSAGWWQWTAPTDAYVQAVDWLGIGHRPGNLVAGNTELFAGIGEMWNGWTALNEWGVGLHMDWHQNANANHAMSRAAIVGLRVNGAGSRSIGAYSRVDGAIVYLNDDYNPTVALNGHTPGIPGTPPSTGWFDPDVTTPTYRLSLADRGLGVWKYGIMRNDTGGMLASVTLPCFGTKVWACPKTFDTGYKPYTASAIPEGVTAVHGAVWDANERVGGSPTWNLRADSTAPQVALSGGIWDSRGAELVDENATLHVAATDGSTASSASQRSGVKQIDVFVDGVLARSTGALACPAGSCPASLDLATSALSAGEHAIRVSVSDQIGHTWSTTFNVTYSLTSAIYGGDDGTVDTDEEAAALGSVLAGQLGPVLFAGLTVDDQNYMMDGSDPYFAQWGPTVDTVAPTPVSDIAVDSADGAAREAEITWDEGTDPDLRADVVGTGIEELDSRFRFRRGAGDWSDWKTTEEFGFTLFSADPGDEVTIEVRETDAAGNVSPSRTETVTIPSPTAQESVVVVGGVIAVECALECPAIAAAATVGVVTAGDWVIDHVEWPIIHVGLGKKVQILLSKEKAEDFDTFQKRGKSQRKTLGKNIENSADPRFRAKRRKGQQAHHIVEVGRKAARYAREVMWRCGIDLNDPRNGVFLSAKKHHRTFRKRYTAAINDIVEKYDPARGGKCIFEDEVFAPNLMQALRDIAEQLKAGKFLNGPLP